MFEHFYDDCVFGGDVSTHYIVLAYEIYLECAVAVFEEVKQHNIMVFRSMKLRSEIDNIHKHINFYFINE